MKKILSPAYSLKVKSIILFLNRDLIFFSNGHIRNFVSTLPSVVKIDVENDIVVSTLSNVVQFNVEIRNVVSTLLNIVNFNVNVHNVVSTLIWHCATSRRDINLRNNVERTLKCLLGLTTPIQIFSCEYYEIFKNAYFKEHLGISSFMKVIY